MTVQCGHTPWQGGHCLSFLSCMSAKDWRRDNLTKESHKECITEWRRTKEWNQICSQKIEERTWQENLTKIAGKNWRTRNLTKESHKRTSQKRIREEKTWLKNHKRNAAKTLEKEEPNCCNLTEIAAKDWSSRKKRTMPWIWRLAQNYPSHWKTSTSANSWNSFMSYLTQQC